MVLFGPILFDHVLTVTVENSRLEGDRAMPMRDVDYRVDRADLGRQTKIIGEIRATTITDAAMELQKLRRLRDGIARTLDLQDGVTTAFSAKMGSLQSSINVENWFTGKYWIQYSVELLEA